MMGDKKRIFNRHPFSKPLANKDIFGRNMTFCYEIDKETFDFSPQTFMLPNKKEEERFAAYSAAHKKDVYIAKPKTGSQGDSIVLCQELHDLPYEISAGN